MSSKPNKITNWVMEVPVLSTAHLTQYTRTMCSSTHRALESHGLMSMVGDGTFMVFAGDELSNLDGIKDRQDLYAALKFCMLNGHEWVRFSPEGCTIEHLPVYGDGLDESPHPAPEDLKLVADFGSAAATLHVSHATGESRVGVTSAEVGGDINIPFSGPLDRRLLHTLARSASLSHDREGKQACNLCYRTFATTETTDSVPCCAGCLSHLVHNDG